MLGGEPLERPFSTSGATVDEDKAGSGRVGKEVARSTERVHSSRRYANPWMCRRPSGMTTEDKLANGYCLRANGLRANRMSR